MARKIRSLTKALSYRLLGSSMSLIVVYVLTGNFVLSGAVGFADLVLKTLGYYVHERIWARIEWGRSYRHEGSHVENTSNSHQPDHLHDGDRSGSLQGYQR